MPEQTMEIFEIKLGFDPNKNLWKCWAWDSSEYVSGESTAENMEDAIKIALKRVNQAVNKKELENARTN